MDVIEFFNELNRMCKFYHIHCRDCPLGDLECECTFHIKNEQIEIVKKWSKENPKKDRLQDFIEKFPNAKINEHGFPKDTCCMCVGYCESCDKPYHNESDCYFCWKQPLEE